MYCVNIPYWILADRKLREICGNSNRVHKNAVKTLKTTVVLSLHTGVSLRWYTILCKFALVPFFCIIFYCFLIEITTVLITVGTGNWEWEKFKLAVQSLTYKLVTSRIRMTRSYDSQLNLSRRDPHYLFVISFAVVCTSKIDDPGSVTSRSHFYLFTGRFWVIQPIPKTFYCAIAFRCWAYSTNFTLPGPSDFGRLTLSVHSHRLVNRRLK